MHALGYACVVASEWSMAMTAGRQMKQSKDREAERIAASPDLERNVLCALLGAVAAAEAYEITWRNGELFIEPASSSGPSPIHTVHRLAA